MACRTELCSIPQNVSQVNEMNVNAPFNANQSNNLTNIIMYRNEIIHKLLIDVFFFFNFLPFEIKTMFYFQHQLINKAHKKKVTEKRSITFCPKTNKLTGSSKALFYFGILENCGHSIYEIFWRLNEQRQDLCDTSQWSIQNTIPSFL